MSPALVPRLGCHWTHFEGKTPYLQRCFAEAGNGPVKTLWGGFLQICVPRVSGVSAAISPDMQCPVSALASGACCCSWHLVLLGSVQALSEFQTNRWTSTQPGTRQSPLLSEDCSPAPGQRWAPGGRMGCGSGDCLGVWDCLGAWGCSCGSTSLGCHSAQESSYAPIPSCGRVEGSSPFF